MNYCEINQIPTYIFETQNSKNENKEVDTIWRIQVRGSYIKFLIAIKELTNIFTGKLFRVYTEVRI